MYKLFTLQDFYKRKSAAGTTALFGGLSFEFYLDFFDGDGFCASGTFGHFELDRVTDVQCLKSIPIDVTSNAQRPQCRLPS